MSRPKIGLMGAGNIGGTIGLLASLKNLGEVVFFDIAGSMAKGKALDMAQSGAVLDFDLQYIGSDDPNVIKDSDVIIVTAGLPRKPGMSRDDLLATNAEIIKTAALNIAKYAPNAFVIVVTNPLDVMVAIMQKYSGLPTNKVVGMAGILDSSRFRCFLAEACDVSVEDVYATVLGGHGDTMVPVVSYSYIAGIPLPEVVKMGWLSQDKLNSIIDRTRKGGGEIVELLKNGSAFYAPAASALAMAEAYILDKKRIVPCASFCKGEYGINNLYVGVPTLIDKNGASKVVEINLTEQEKAQLKVSVDAVKELMDAVQKLGF